MSTISYPDALTTASHSCSLPGGRLVPAAVVRPLIDRLDQLEASAHEAAWGRSRTGA